MESLLMPTLECLDERSKQILDRLKDMDDRIAQRLDSFEEGVGKRLSKVEEDLASIKQERAREDGQKTVTLWVGGAVLAMLGAIGNMLLVWILGPKGPLGH
jgi:hypothetical protein